MPRARDAATIVEHWSYTERRLIPPPWDNGTWQVHMYLLSYHTVLNGKHENVIIPIPDPTFFHWQPSIIIIPTPSLSVLLGFMCFSILQIYWLYLNHLREKLYTGNITMYIQFIPFLHTELTTGSWNLSSCKTRTRQFYMVIITSVDILVI